MTGPGETLTGSVAVITGGASGIGRATALRYAAKGGAVAVLDFNEGAARDLARLIGESGGRAIGVRTDVRREADLLAAVAAARAHFGRIDFLLNNAFASPAGFRPCLTEDLATSHWRDTLEVVLDAAFHATRAVLPLMRAQGRGSIVNISSISGVAGDRGGIAYSTAKAGILNFTRVIAIEYAKYGVRCNAISPGVVDTPLIGALDAMPDFKASLLNCVPLGRPGTPEEIANLAVFLASDLASFITGAAITADGGQTAQTGLPSPLPPDRPAP